MGIFLKIVLLLLLSLLILVGVLFFRAEVYYSGPTNEPFCNQTHAPIQGDDLIERFSQALKFKTITQDTQKYETSEREKFAQFLRNSFPTIYSSPLVSFETVNNYSLLYHVKGSDQTLKPYLLCSHLDVVPVEMKHWNYDPFGGIVKDGYIYGRGTLDLKNTLMAIMESLEYLLKNNFKPKRSFFIAIGHDEEGMGVDGAASIAETFHQKGIKEFEFLFDEGAVIVRDVFPYIKKDIAFIGVAEKGYLTLKIKSKGQVGHSSIPTEDTAITSLARAVSKLTSTAHKNFFGQGPEVKMFEEFALHTTYPTKLIFSNLWLFGPLVSRVMSTKPQSNALVRTTSAVTMINGGFKANVLPSEAEAIVNHRVHMAQTVKEVIEFDRQLINDDNIEIEAQTPYHEAHPISPHDDDSFGYQSIRKSVYEVFENIVVIPGIMLATTDTKWYLPFTKNIYRFSPSIIAPDDFKLFHGHNERISKDNYIKTINFYHHLMINADKDKLEPKVAKDEL